jgi:hypothetical protein
MENFMQMSDGEGLALLALLLLLPLSVLAVLGLIGWWLWKLLCPPAPDPTPHVADVSQAGKWVLLGLLLVMLIGLVSH